MSNNTPRGTVYVLTESIIPGSNGVPIDYSPAEQYGNVEFVVHIEPSRQRQSTINAAIYRQLLQMAELYREGRDYLVLTGNPMVIFMAGMAMVEVDKVPTLLMWDRKRATYNPIVVAEKFEENV